MGWKRQDPDVDGVTPPEIYQNAIGAGTADGNGLTTFSACSGQDVCVFDSILFAQFYQTPGAVSGDGIATLQFAPTARRLRANGESISRKLQQAESAADFGLSVDVNAINDGPGVLAPARSGCRYGICFRSSSLNRTSEASYFSDFEILEF